MRQQSKIKFRRNAAFGRFAPLAAVVEGLRLDGRGVI
jgi:hypothetical protein